MFKNLGSGCFESLMLLGCIYLINYTVQTVILLNFTVKNNFYTFSVLLSITINLILLKAKLNFQYYYSCLQCRMILQKSF